MYSNPSNLMSYYLWAKNKLWFRESIGDPFFSFILYFSYLFFSNTLSNRFFIYSLSQLNIISSFFFYSFFNISLFFLYSFLTDIFVKFPTTIFFKFHNIFKFCSKKRTRGENISFFLFFFFSFQLFDFVGWLP